MKKTSHDLVIFDCDGVLVDSEPLANQVYVQMLAEYGFQVNTEEYLHKYSGAAIVNRLESTSKQLNWTPPSDFYPVFNSRLSVLTRQHLKPVPGTHELLDSLTAPVCIASNGSRSEVILRLKIADLAKYFGENIFSGVDLPNPKPAPDVYLAAAKSFDIPPSRCVVIEDSVLGVTAGVRAGMKVYGYAACTSAERLKEAGAIPFMDMLELKSILSE
jgi:HAD superfamily hydrolase (TIGR01509 family)